MNESENLVIEEVTENTEQTVEETPAAKTFTQEEVDAMMGKRLARQEARIKKEYDRKYGDLENVIRAGTGMQSVEEMTDGFTKFYEGKGKTIPKRNEYDGYSAKDLETLAKAEADEFISAGYEDVVEEVDRLTALGADKMNAREKALFKVLAEHRASAERNQELAAIGVTEDVYNSPEFKEFADQYKSNVPITKIYDQFIKSKPQKDYKIMGSMKNTTAADNGVKDFYSFEEASKFSKEYLDSHPEVYQKILKSMPKW